MNLYRRNVLRLLLPLLEPHAPFPRALDFGAGDGSFVEELLRRGLARQVVPVEVRWRRETRLRPLLYDGSHLPFPDRAFDLVYAIDVLHHCPQPRASLEEMARCAGRYLLLKDHTSRGLLDRLVLGLLDELGNRRFGVPSTYRYQRGWEWLAWLEELGFTLERMIRPTLCQTRPPLVWLTHRLQFIGLWRRSG